MLENEIYKNVTSLICRMIICDINRSLPEKVCVGKGFSESLRNFWLSVFPKDDGYLIF